MTQIEELGSRLSRNLDTSKGESSKFSFGAEFKEGKLLLGDLEGIYYIFPTRESPMTSS